MIFQKIKGILIVFSICMLFSFFCFYSGNQFLGTKVSTNDIRYILDAGHGLPDGGTVGADGTTEATLNLMITQKLSYNLKEAGISHQLTRKNDKSIYSSGNTIHEKKVSDIRNRIKIAMNLSEIPLVSIHMNSYPDSSVYGIQVFYGNGDNAQTIATALQNRFNKELQPNHQKAVKEVSKNIYLFSHIDNPVILIECGFLSNNSELTKLKDSEYQGKIAAIIAEVLSMQS